MLKMLKVFSLFMFLKPKVNFLNVNVIEGETLQRNESVRWAESAEGTEND